MSTMLIVVLFFAILMGIILYCHHDDTKFLWCFSVIWALAFMVSVLVFTGIEENKPSAIPATQTEENVYYVYAEKVAQDDNFITFRTVNLEENQEFVYEDFFGNEYPEVPYLLTMDSKGTVDIKDDEILVVWMTY